MPTHTTSHTQAQNTQTKVVKNQPPTVAKPPKATLTTLIERCALLQIALEKMIAIAEAKLVFAQ